MSSSAVCYCLAEIVTGVESIDHFVIYILNLYTVVPKNVF